MAIDGGRADASQRWAGCLIGPSLPVFRRCRLATARVILYRRRRGSSAAVIEDRGPLSSPPRRLTAIALLILVCFAFWAALQPSLAPPDEGGADKILHVLCFALFGGMAVFAFDRRMLWVAAAGLLAFGAAIEIAQHFVPDREGSIGDWLGDAVGLVIGIGLAEILRRQLRPAMR